MRVSRVSDVPRCELYASARQFIFNVVNRSQLPVSPKFVAARVEFNCRFCGVFLIQKAFGGVCAVIVHSVEVVFHDRNLQTNFNSHQTFNTFFSFGHKKKPPTFRGLSTNE